MPASVLTRAQLAAGTVLFCLAAIIAVSRGDTKTSDGFLEVFPKVLDLGSVPQGTSGQAEFILRNPSSEPIVIGKLEKTCPCLDIRLSGTAIPPGAELRGEAFLDMSREPSFAGNLAIELRGKTSEEKSALSWYWPTFAICADCDKWRKPPCSESKGCPYFLLQ
jgi:hypothetical protein